MKPLIEEVCYRSKTILKYKINTLLQKYEKHLYFEPQIPLRSFDMEVLSLIVARYILPPCGQMLSQQVSVNLCILGDVCT